MSDTEIHLLTVVAEAVLEDRLVREVSALGATGWTVTPCRGHGSGGSHASDFEGGNVRVEVLVPTDRLESVWSLLERDYFDRYSTAAWSAPVRVRRTQKFSGNPDAADGQG
jgi:nitrogen regulatory protein P-II 2